MSWRSGFSMRMTANAHADFSTMSTQQLEAPVEVKSEVSAPAPALPLGEQIRELIGGKTSLVRFSDLRDAAQRLGISAKRKADGSVSSVNALDRAVFLVLFARFCQHGNVTKGQLFELVGISRTMSDDGAKGPDGALFFREGTVKGESATLGTMKVRPAGQVGRVTLD